MDLCQIWGECENDLDLLNENDLDLSKVGPPLIDHREGQITGINRSGLYKHFKN